MAGLDDAERFVVFQTGTPMCLADLTRSDFQPSGADAARGLVPAPPSTPGTTLFLREDATWATVDSVGTASVTNEMLATMADSTFKGRAAGAGAGEPQDLTASEATAILNIFVSASVGKKGLVPAPTTSDVGKVLGATGWVEGVTKLTAVTVNGATNAISIDLSSFQTYRALEFRLWGIRPTQDNDTLLVRFSATGVTYDATDYSSVYTYSSNAGTPTRRSVTAGAAIELCFILGSATNETYGGIINITNFAESTARPMITFQGFWTDGSDGTLNNIGGGYRRTQQKMLGLQVLASGGTVKAGEIYVYGYR